MRLKKIAVQSIDSSIKHEIAKTLKKQVVDNVKQSNEYVSLNQEDKNNFNDWLDTLSVDYQFSNEINLIIDQIINSINEQADIIAKQLLNNNK